MSSFEKLTNPWSECEIVGARRSYSQKCLAKRSTAATEALNEVENEQASTDRSSLLGR